MGEWRTSTCFGIPLSPEEDKVDYPQPRKKERPSNGDWEAGERAGTSKTLFLNSLAIDSTPALNIDLDQAQRVSFRRTQLHGGLLLVRKDASPTLSPSRLAAGPIFEEADHASTEAWRMSMQARRDLVSTSHVQHPEVESVENEEKRLRSPRSVGRPLTPPSWAHDRPHQPSARSLTVEFDSLRVVLGRVVDLKEVTSVFQDKGVSMAVFCEAMRRACRLKVMSAADKKDFESVFAFATLGSSDQIHAEEFAAFVARCATYHSDQVKADVVGTFQASQVARDSDPFMSLQEAVEWERLESAKAFRMAADEHGSSAFHRREAYDKGWLGEGVGGRVSSSVISAERTGTFRAGLAKQKVAYMLSHDVERMKFLSGVDLLALCDRRGPVHLYSPDGKLRAKLHGHSGAVFNVVQLPHRPLLLTSSLDGTFRLWDTVAGMFSSRGSIPLSQPQLSLATNRQFDVFYSGGTDGAIRVWDPRGAVAWKEAEPPLPIHSINNAHSDLVTDLVGVEGSTIVASCGIDAAVRLWDMSSGQCFHNLKGHRFGVQRLAFSPIQRLLASAGGDHDVFLWSALAGDTLVSRLTGHNAPLVGVEAVRGNHQLISVDSIGFVKVWDLRMFAAVQTLSFAEHPDVAPVAGKHAGLARPGALAYCHGHARLAVGGSVLAFFDGTSDASPWLTDHRPIADVVYNASSKTFATAAGRDIKVWNGETGKLQRVYRNVTSAGITALALDKAGFVVFSADNGGHVLAHNYNSGQRMKSFDGHCDSIVTFLEFSIARHELLSGGMDRLVISHHEGSDLLTSPHSHARNIAGGDEDSGEMHEAMCANISDSLGLLCVGTMKPPLKPSSGKGWASGGGGGSVHIWDMKRHARAGTLRGCQGDVTAVCLLAPFPVVVAADRNGFLRMWSLPPARPRHLLILVWRNLHAGTETQPVNTMVWSANEMMLYTGDEAGQLKAWSLRNALRLSGLEAFAPDSDVVGRLKLANVKGFTCDASVVTVQLRWQGHEDAVARLRMIQSRALLSCGKDGRVRVWTMGGLYQGTLRQGTSDGHVGSWGFKA